MLHSGLKESTSTQISHNLLRRSTWLPLSRLLCVSVSLHSVLIKTSWDSYVDSFSYSFRNPFHCVQWGLFPAKCAQLKHFLAGSICLLPLRACHFMKVCKICRSGEPRDANRGIRIKHNQKRDQRKDSKRKKSYQ